MKVHKTLNKVAFENTYYLENNSHILLIDPGSDWQKINRKLKTLNKPITAILLTHVHYDHIASIDLVRKYFQHPPVYVSEHEASWLFTPTCNLSGLARHNDIDDVIIQPAENFLCYDKEYDMNGFRFYVSETPGHSIGSVSFIFSNDDLILTGDTLFRENVGRSDLPTGNYNNLITSIKTKIFSLPGHFQVYPGHGHKTTIAHEQKFNPFLLRE